MRRQFLQHLVAAIRARSCWADMIVIELSERSDKRRVEPWDRPTSHKSKCLLGSVQAQCTQAGVAWECSVALLRRLRVNGVVKVLIVSEVRLWWEALVEVMCHGGRLVAQNFTAVGTDVVDALCSLVEIKPDVILIDAAIANGPSTVRRMKQILPGAAVIVLALAETEESVIAWAEAGVIGYVPKTVSLSRVVPMIVDIIAGQQPSSSRVTAGLLRRVATTSAHALLPGSAITTRQLTGREREIMRLVGSGLSNKKIAKQLNIEVATTKAHVHSLLSKLNLQRRTQIAALIATRIPDDGGVAVIGRTEALGKTDAAHAAAVGIS